MDVSIAAQFADVVDTVVGSDVVDAEDAAVTAVEYGDCFQTVCGAVEDGEVLNEEVATLNVSSFELACSSAESGVVVDVESDGAALVFEDEGGDDVAVVTMATWQNDVGNVSDVGENETVVTSDVVTVHVTGSNGSNVVNAVDIEDTTVTLVLGLGSSGELEAVRKSASCRYLDEEREVWLERGMFLRGLAVEFKEVVASAICVSTHLTMMATVDKSALERIAEEKVLAFAGRVERMIGVEMDPATNEPNWFVIGIFAGVAAVFVVTIFGAKMSGRKKAVLVGRELYVQQGRLFRPSVVGAAGSEAILRGWLSTKEVVLMGFVHVMSGNPFIGLFFHWSHADIVFSRADKATALFAGLLINDVHIDSFFCRFWMGVTSLERRCCWRCLCRLWRRRCYCCRSNMFYRT